MASSDVVAKWDVTLSDRVHRVEFEHGTTTGKRVIRVDGNVCELQTYYFTMSFTSQTYYFTMSFSNCITSTSDSVVVGEVMQVHYHHFICRRFSTGCGTTWHDN